MLDKSQVLCPTPSCPTHTLVFQTTRSNPGWVTKRLKVILAAVAQHRDYKRYFIIRLLYRRAAWQSGCSRFLRKANDTCGCCQLLTRLFAERGHSWPSAHPQGLGTAPSAHGLVHTNHPISHATSLPKAPTELFSSQSFKEFSNSTQHKQITILNIDTGMEA